MGKKLKVTKVQKPIVGVYILYKKKEILYIGESTYCQLRILTHTKTKDFDSYLIIQCSGENRFNEEAKKIIELKPKLNKTLNYKNTLYKAIISKKERKLLKDKGILPVFKNYYERSKV